MVYKLDYTDTEVWKVINEHPYQDLEMYEVSNLGRVRSRARHIERKGGGSYFRQSYVRRPFLCGRGFVTVTLFTTDENKPLTVRVHRLVATMFLPKEINKEMIVFLDGNRKNCSVTNLMYVSSIHENYYNP